MAWFHNHYQCARCGAKWTDEWSAMCDDDCRACGARHMSPYDSDDLTEVVVPSKDGFALLRSSDDAEATPDYQTVASFGTREQALAQLSKPAPSPGG
ncbi:MAG: hypothetical protein WD688_27170 [Candidatus Binatia bacterium]